MSLGHRYNVAVPIGQVAQVTSHFVTLSIDRDAFKRAPLTQVVRAGSHFVKPTELWREVLGRPTNKLWDSFGLDPTHEELSAAITEDEEE